VTHLAAFYKKKKQIKNTAAAQFVGLWYTAALLDTHRILSGFHWWFCLPAPWIHSNIANFLLHPSKAQILYCWLFLCQGWPGEENCHVQCLLLGLPE